MAEGNKVVWWASIIRIIMLIVGIGFLLVSLYTGDGDTGIPGVVLVVIAWAWRQAEGAWYNSKFGKGSGGGGFEA